MKVEINWQPVVSDAVTHEAYDSDSEAIYLRFNDGAEWRYEECPVHVWEEFTAPGQSRGQYFHRVLKFKPSSKIN